ncbi:metallophosphoesterase [Balneolales bacterium ANBcel1]|nr:metallophosphoesterase [Balneolales bacterium ANBcel1]
MERFIPFAIFFTVFFSVFGFIQWYLLRSYLRWLRGITLGASYHRYRRLGIGVLIAANIVFVLRFPSTDLGWYDNPWFQAFIIYPGGIFFGALILAFMLLVAFSIGQWTLRKLYLLRQKRMRSLHSRNSEEYSDGAAPTFKSAAHTVNADPEHRDHPPADGADESGSRGNTNSVTAGHGDVASGERATDNFDTAASDNPAQGLFSRREFLKATGTAMITAPVAFTIGASAATSHDYQVVKKKLFFPGLPPGLDGLRIVQLSDIHSGIYMTENQIRDIFHLANEQNPDLVTITGDFVDNSVSEIPALYRALPELKTEFGVFGCLGNHDHYASADKVASALGQRGVTVLTNNRSTLEIDGGRLTLLGVDDPVSGTPDRYRLDEATRNLPDDAFRILLTHRPDTFDLARESGIDLTLAGHTHGGQVGLNLMGLPLYPIYLFQKYPMGLFEYDAHKLYVNVGIGMVGAPVRTVRPEMTVIDLTRTPPGSDA